MLPGFSMNNQSIIFTSELFSSIQGESRFTGLPTTFIRTAGCNLRCSWCDSAFSYKNGTPYTVEAILAFVQEKKLPYVCVTGGEPLVQPALYILLEELIKGNYTISLETNGSYSIEKIPEQVHIILDVKCPGSGQEKANYYPNLDRVTKKDDVKFVIKDYNDFLYAVDIIHNYQLLTASNPLLSPAYGLCDPKDLVAWMLKHHLPARLNMQLHKCIWSPETRGV